MNVSFQPKSKSNDGKVYLWVMADIGGEFKAVCYEAKSISEMMSDGFLAHASNRARAAFEKSGIKKSRIILAGN